MTQYQKGSLVMKYLRELGANSEEILIAIGDENLEQSYQLIRENPGITKEEFLAKMPMEESEFTPMQEALIEVLAYMPLAEEDKVLIVMLLPKDEQIYEFLGWLKQEVPENQIKIKEQEIIAKAVEISKAK